MTFNGKTVLSGNFFLKSFDALVLEFDDFAAGDADQVVMVFIEVAGFITCLAISEMTLLSDTALGKQLQCPVHGRITDPGIFPAQAQIQLFGRNVRAKTQKLIEDGFSLAG